MVVVEREISGWELAPNTNKSSSVTSFSLQTTSSSAFPGFLYTISFPLANAVRVLLTGPDRPAPPHDNVVLPVAPLEVEVTVDSRTCSATIPFPATPSHARDFDAAKRRREVRLDWTDSILLSIWEESDSGMVRVCGDLPSRSYALTEHGVMRHWWMERDNIHLGMGEKAGPLDLTGRSFQIHGSDSACYDAYEGDPLYKHTPFLVSAPRAKEGEQQRSTYAIYHASNSNALWDLGRHHDDPWGYFKTFTQDWGGLEEWYLLGKGVKEVTRTWAEVVGKPMLVSRDWLGYIASGMGLGESDDPPAQELLSQWPDMCGKHEIPCSAIHVSDNPLNTTLTLSPVLVRLHRRRRWQPLRLWHEQEALPRLQGSHRRPPQGGDQGRSQHQALHAPEPPVIRQPVRL